MVLGTKNGLSKQLICEQTIVPGTQLAGPAAPGVRTSVPLGLAMSGWGEVRDFLFSKAKPMSVSRSLCQEVPVGCSSP